MYHNFLIHLSADGHLGCFHALAIANSAEMNTEVYMSLSILVSSVYMPRSGIAGSQKGTGYINKFFCHIQIFFFQSEAFLYVTCLG